MNANLAKLKANVDVIDKIYHMMPDWLQDLVKSEGFADTCAEMFAKVDEDGNGCLTPDELFPIIEELVDEHPLSITLSHCVKFAEVFDANKDGVISKDEFNVFVKFILCYETLEADPELLDRCLAEQAEYEEERAGMEDDVDAMIEQAEGEAGVDASLKLLKQARCSADDYIDKMPQWCADLITGPMFQSTCDELFKAIDEDGNGVLTPEELFPVISEMCTTNSGAPTDERFITLDHCIEFANMFDKNQDGVISMSEFSDFVKFALVYEQLLNHPELIANAMEMDSMADERIREGLQKLKGNKTKVDQLMSKLPSWLTEMFTSEDFLAQCNVMFDRCDVEKKGVLSPKDLVPVVMELSQENANAITTDHCQTFIDIFDPGQKVITRDAAIDFMKFMFTYEALLSDPDMLQAALDGKPSTGPPPKDP